MMFEALKRGHHFPWDFQPLRDASEQYTRNHMSVTDRDLQSRYPTGAGYSEQAAEIDAPCYGADSQALAHRCKRCAWRLVPPQKALPSFRVTWNLPVTFTAFMSTSG